MMTVKPWWYCLELQCLDYQIALQLQRALVPVVADDDAIGGVVLLLEHPPVYTLGRRGGRENLTVSEQFLQNKRIPVIPIERGGDITYHGPGQLVGYPIVSLKRAGIKVVDYVYRLEEVMLRTAAGFKIQARRDTRNRGIWIGDAKLGSIGIHVRRGVSFHGFAVNVCTDLTPFGWINPCGLQGIGVTSMAEHCHEKVRVAAVRSELKRHLSDVFHVELTPVNREQLAGMAGLQEIGAPT